MAPPNDYQKNWGPRWHVKSVEGSPLPTEISEDDALSFEGQGTEGSGGTLKNLTTGLNWGTDCKHVTGDKVELKRKGATWTITRSLISGKDRYQLVAKAPSGSGTWTATEG